MNSNTRRLIAATAGALMLAAPLTACGDNQKNQAQAAKDGTSASPAVKSSSTPTPPPPPKAHPKGTYRSSCDYLLGDFTVYSSSGYRFTADVTVHNTGNVTTTSIVSATWNQAGGHRITRGKTLHLKPGESKRTGFIVPTGGDQIDQYQGLGYGTNCHVKVSIVDYSGTPKG